MELTLWIHGDARRLGLTSEIVELSHVSKGKTKQLERGVGRGSETKVIQHRGGAAPSNFISKTLPT